MCASRASGRRVASVELNPQTYFAEARLHPRHDPPAHGQRCADQSDGLLGGSYIELQPGGAPENLAPGTRSRMFRRCQPDLVDDEIRGFQASGTGNE